MGNYRFRFSDMIPNAWFYKLKDMSRTRKHHSSHPMKKRSSSHTTTSQKPHISQPRYSYYFTTDHIGAAKVYNSPVHPKASDTHFPDPPRQSSKKRAKRKTIYKPSPILVSSSVSAGCGCHATLNSVWTKSNTTPSPDYSLSPVESYSEPNLPDYLLSDSDCDDFVDPDSFHQLDSWSSTSNCKVSSSTADIIIDMNNESSIRKIEKLDGFDTISEIELPPIVTKTTKLNDKTTETTKFRRRSSKLEEIKAHRSLSLKIVKEESFKTQKEQRTNPLIRKSSTTSTGIRIRANSPRMASKKVQAYARKSVSSNTCLKSRNRSISESFAVVKSSLDPQRDFKDSMVEMIVENNIRASKDLEDLLACYLSLNSDEYHDLIVKAFEQIWFDMTDLRL